MQPNGKTDNVNGSRCMTPHALVCVCDVSKNWTQWKTKSARLLTHTHIGAQLNWKPKKGIKTADKARLVCVCVFRGSCRQMSSVAAPQMRRYHEFHVNPTYKGQNSCLYCFLGLWRWLIHTHRATHSNADSESGSESERLIVFYNLFLVIAFHTYS